MEPEIYIIIVRTGCTLYHAHVRSTASLWAGTAHAQRAPALMQDHNVFTFLPRHNQSIIASCKVLGICTLGNNKIAITKYNTPTYQFQHEESFLWHIAPTIQETPQLTTASQKATARRSRFNVHGHPLHSFVLRLRVVLVQQLVTLRRL